MTRMQSTLKSRLAAATLMLGLGCPLAALGAPGIVYDIGGKFDKSYNEAAWRGMSKWKQETGASFLEFEIASETQREQSMRRMAEHGTSPIIAVGFSQAAALQKVASDFPKLQFTLIDSIVNLPNVESVVFKEHEGTFLVGMLAALASKTGKVGFIGGMDTPLIRKFQCGYTQGAKHANASSQVVANMIGDTAAAWKNPALGGELAKSQFSRSVDVVFAAAGASGFGVYQAAKDEGKLAVGVDSNQDHLQPGTMLTSMVKRVDLAVYQSLKAWHPGVTTLGLKEGGVDYTLDDDNARLITADMKKRVDLAKAEIVAGKIAVVDYTATDSCKF